MILVANKNRQTSTTNRKYNKKHRKKKSSYILCICCPHGKKKNSRQAKCAANSYIFKLHIRTNHFNLIFINRDEMKEKT